MPVKWVALGSGLTTGRGAAPGEGARYEHRSESKTNLHFTAGVMASVYLRKKASCWFRSQAPRKTPKSAN